LIKTGQNYCFKGFIETSFIEWPGRIVSVVFLPGCNFRCPWCHNLNLVLYPETLPDIPISNVITRINELAGWVDGVVITGGEPTVSANLPDIIQLFADHTIEVKLDTNGSRPDVLETLLTKNLLSGISMDIKAPLNIEKYSAVAGVPVDIRVIEQSIRLIIRSGIWYEFRTTVLADFHTDDDIEQIQRVLHDVSGPEPLQRPLKLQRARPAVL
jgi:pyruvate formate lyase activating enzyme